LEELIDFLIRRTWWTYNPGSDWYAHPYHWINLIEGCFWLVFAGLVLKRYWRHRHSPIELLYAFTFLTFALSDFREAYVVQSWLILLKGVNLIGIIYLRRTVIRRFYPSSKTY